MKVKVRLYNDNFKYSFTTLKTILEILEPNYFRTGVEPQGEVEEMDDNSSEAKRVKLNDVTYSTGDETNHGLNLALFSGNIASNMFLATGNEETDYPFTK